MIYLEFNNWIVDRRHVPASLCCMKGKSENIPFVGGGTSQIMAMAERIYEVKGNEAIDLKNRTGIFERRFISDEDKVVLKLKAVLL